MEMNSRTYRVASLGVVAASVLASGYYYPQLPAEMASHWNAAGEVDGTMPKLWGTFLFPLLIAGLAVLLEVAPRIDPRRENYEAFGGAYRGFVLLILGFLLYVHLLVLWWNLGLRFDLATAMIPALAVLYFAIGVLVERAEPNWFVGIRTPWTLSDDRVWERTHERSARLFKLAGVLAMVGVVAPTEYAVLFIVGPVLVASLYAVAYSYVEFRRIGA